MAGETPDIGRQNAMSAIALRVRGYHVDAFGHVNHGRYVELLEEARWAFFDEWPALTAALQAKRIIHAVVNIHVDYKSQATVGDLLRIETAPIRVGRSSLLVEQTIRQADSGKVVVVAKVLNVYLDSASVKPTSVRADLLAHWPGLDCLEPGAVDA